jgi:NUDIX domain
VPGPILSLYTVDVSESNRRLEWRTHGERRLYENRWLSLSLVDVEPPNHQRFEHHVVRLGRVAIALVIDADERVLTLWRYRFATDDWGYELLGGIVEEGEESAATASREVEEESGYRPTGEAEHLISFESAAAATAPAGRRPRRWVGCGRQTALRWLAG